MGVGRRLLGQTLLAASKFWTAGPICRRLLPHDMRLAASRAACAAGKSNATRTPIMAMTTSSSTNVKAGRGGRMAGKAAQGRHMFPVPFIHTETQYQIET